MVSLCITTFKRDSLVLEAIQQVANDERISEIVICDDASKGRYLENIRAFSSSWPKIKIFENKSNLGCYYNKREAVRHATNDWIILLDSDNVINTDYIDALFRYNTQWGWNRKTILAPEFAFPTFDYRHFSGATIRRQNVSGFVGKTRFDCLINTANYFFHREEYLNVFEEKIEPWTADTIFMNYNWLKAGNDIHVLKDLQYFHRTEDFKGQEGSHYKTHNRKTNGLGKSLENKLKLLR